MSPNAASVFGFSQGSLKFNGSFLISGPLLLFTLSTSSPPLRLLESFWGGQEE